MKRSLAWSWLIGAVLYAISTWLSADGFLVLGAALDADPAHAATPHPTAANGGSRAVSSASAG